MSRQTTGLCLYTEHLSPNTTIEVCKRYLSPEFDDLESEIVFIFNDRGVYFHVFKSIAELWKFIQVEAGNASLVWFETSEELDLYLTGNTLDK